ncbi:MAG: hypothetical protein AB4352_21185 [Hormoscilla sp.]
MNEPRIPTQLHLHERDRALLKRIKPLIGDSSMSAAASFVFDKTGEQLIAWLEGEPHLRFSIASQFSSNSNQPDTDSSRSGTNDSQAGTTLVSRSNHDAISDLDALLGS